jgi:hypothetical protein
MRHHAACAKAPYDYRNGQPKAVERVITRIIWQLFIPAGLWTLQPGIRQYH